MRYVGGVVGYNGGMINLKSNYLNSNKIGYFDNIGLQTYTLDKICQNVGIKKDDITEIIEKTHYLVEGAIVYNSGNRIFINGSSIDRVELKKELIRDSLIIHSHPSGSSFSAEDIFETITFGGGKLIAFNDEHLYVFKNSVKDDVAFMKIVKSTSLDIENQLINRVNSGTITKSQMLFAINHKIWLSLSEKIEEFDYVAYKIK